MEVKEKLIVALDVAEEEEVKQLVDILGNMVSIYKVGLEQYLASRGKVLDFLREKGKKVFLDLKFHDIPNTMGRAARQVVRERVWMMNIHISGEEAMKRVVNTVREEADLQGVIRPLVIGVTLLTSLDKNDLLSLGLHNTPAQLVKKRARLAFEAGLDGVVASPAEAALIAEELGGEFLRICPGIRPDWAQPGDQKRVMTPGEALKAQASYLVIGRPITGAEDPAWAAKKILKEMGEAC